jgi:polysaccharide deacetylase family protein (PEP-CTERM system associated)
MSQTVESCTTSMRGGSNELLHALTIDVEDYFQVSGFERQVDRNDWDSYPSRVVPNTMRLLEILAAHQVKATFYVLGWVADRFPQLVREIHAAGHEVGSHSYWHRLIYRISPAEFRRDLRDSQRILADQTGEMVTTFRAPSFSITRDSTWALEILAEEGDYKPWEKIRILAGET